MAEDHWVYKKPRIIVFLLIPGLIIQALCEGWQFIALFVYGLDVRQFEQPDFVPDVISSFYALSSLAIMSLMVINFLLLMFWVYRICANTHALGVNQLQYEPNWAVGWWFIPIANLMAPFVVMSELHNANKSPHDWAEGRKSRLLILWWAMNICGLLASLLYRLIGDSDGNIDPSQVLAAVYAFGTLRIALLCIVVLRIGKFQDTAHVKPGVEQVF